jgi:hypothetical protein
MKETVIAHIRKPTDEELKRMRELWGALKQKSVPASTAIGVELQTYLQHAIRMVGLVAGLRANPLWRGLIPCVFRKTALHGYMMRCGSGQQSWHCGPLMAWHSQNRPTAASWRLNPGFTQNLLQRPSPDCDSLRRVRIVTEASEWRTGWSGHQTAP